MGPITEERRLLNVEYKPDGYNIGTNIGPAAGQSIFHAHIHIIPRYQEDVENRQGAHMCLPGMHTTRDSGYNIASFVLTDAEQ